MAGMPGNLSLGASRNAAAQQRLFSQGAAELPVADLLPNPENGRKRLRAVESLADSFDDDGVVQALTVVPAAAYIAHYPKHREHVENSQKPFVVIHGHRRLAAATMKGLTKVPVFVRKTVAENGSLRLSAIKENEQRLGLDPIEAAEDYQAALDELGISQRELARRLGNTSQPMISQTIKLLKLIEPLQQAVIDQWCKTKGMPLEFGGELLVTVQDGATVLASLREDLQQDFATGRLTFEEAQAIVKSKVPLEEQRRPEASPATPADGQSGSSADAGTGEAKPTSEPGHGQDGPVPGQRNAGTDDGQTPSPTPGAPAGEKPTGSTSNAKPEEDEGDKPGESQPAPGADAGANVPPTNQGQGPSDADSPGTGTGAAGTEGAGAVAVAHARGVIEVTSVKEIYTGLKERLSPDEFTELQELFLMD
ncbi:ParB/RepB/Spo0J family partition protein [Streptomyces tendae]|uniref:ParB/RepB/Spo0J family partition protein n=1 Tax=Streptomyces tendae TaxID=1932 RepID=UPI003EB9B057